MVTAGILLAAGESQRMGAAPKLLLPVAGEPLVRVSARILVDAGLSPVIAVLGCRAPEVERALTGLPLRCVTNTRFAQGMGTSLAVGIAALPAPANCAVVALGDMPAVQPDTIRALLENRGERGIAVPTYRGRRGHPVLFDLACYREQLEALDGEQGARTILDAHPDDVARVPVEDSGVVLDLDTPEEYQAWLRRERNRGGKEVS